MRYVHLNDDDVRAAMAKERGEKSGHTFGHTKEVATWALPINTHKLLIVNLIVEPAEGFEPPTL